MKICRKIISKNFNFICEIYYAGYKSPTNVLYIIYNIIKNFKKFNFKNFKDKFLSLIFTEIPGDDFFPPPPPSGGGQGGGLGANLPRTSTPQIYKKQNRLRNLFKLKKNKVRFLLRLGEVGLYVFLFLLAPTHGGNKIQKPLDNITYLFQKENFSNFRKKKNYDFDNFENIEKIETKKIENENFGKKNELENPFIKLIKHIKYIFRIDYVKNKAVEIPVGCPLRRLTDFYLKDDVRRF